MALFGSKKVEAEAAPAAKPVPAPAPVPQAKAPAAKAKGKHSVENVGDWVPASFSSERFEGFGFWDVAGTQVFMFHDVFCGTKEDKNMLKKGNAIAQIRFGDRVGCPGQYQATEMKDLQISA